MSVQHRESGEQRVGGSYRIYVAASGWELADAKALDEKAKRNVKNKLVGQYSIMCS